MDDLKGLHSRWRIELAGRLAAAYSSMRGVRMIVLGGSPSRGLSDEYSDLDVVVYWDEIDFERLESPVEIGYGAGRRAVLGSRDAGFLLESYCLFGTLKADFGHITVTEWEKWTRDVLEGFDDDPDKLGSFAGFLSAVPLYGGELYESMRERLASYPDELVEKVVRRNCRFFVQGSLRHQGMDRGEVLFLADGVTRMLKQVLSIIAAVNRVYFSPDDPRWIESRFDGLEVLPAGMWPRMKRILALDGPGALDELEGLIEDTLGIVEARVPAIDVAALRSRRSGLAVLATEPRDLDGC